MTEMLLALTAFLAALSAALSAFLYRKCSRSTANEPLTREQIAYLLRNETEIIRRSADDQARDIRQELASSLKLFQETTITSFGVLSKAVGEQVRTFGERLDAGVEAIDGRVNGMSEKLRSSVAEIESSFAKSQDTLRNLVETKLDAFGARYSEEAKNLRDELSGSFHRLGASTTTTLTELAERQTERLDKSTLALEALSEKNDKSNEALRRLVEERLDTIRQENSSKLDQMRQTVDDKLQSTLDSRLGESFNRVVEQLNRVHEGLGEMKTLAANVGDLKSVLSNVKVRGTFGEVQLEMLLEQFLTPDQYIKNAKVRENTSERVEFAIRLPGKGAGSEVLLAIDAKFPRESYDRLLDASEAGDTNLVLQCRRQLEVQVRACAKGICEKYINPPTTTDFAILFLPTEGLYAEVLRQAGMFECLQRDHKVILAGPTTLSAILNALQMGFRSLAIEKRSGEVWQVLGAVQAEFGKYNKVVDQLANQLSTAANSVESLGRRTRAMNRKLRTVEALPNGDSAAALLGFENGMEDELAGMLGGENGTSAPASQPAAALA